MAVPVQTNRKRRPRRPPILKYFWLALVLAGVALLIWLATGPRWWGPRVLSRPGAPMQGYIGSLQTVQQEYLRFQGKPLRDPAVERLFQLANQRAAQHDYQAAAKLLEKVSQEAAVPAVFNDLGVLYAQLNDRARAINAFREALARDIDYQPVRFNLDRLRDLAANTADPVTRELEPNNSPALANVIAPGRPVEGEIAPGVNDVDCFRVTTPPAPRDMLQIVVDPLSPELSPVLRIFDADRSLTGMSAGVRAGGDTLTFSFAPAPNSTFYLEISGAGFSAGKYTLKAMPMRAFDSYEPNDDILNARRIEVGRAIEANIMDAADTDYYSFIAPRTGSVTVTIHNRSTTLIPALTTFSGDMRNTGFGPDIRTAGADLRHAFNVVENQTYYIQVWPAKNTAGEYSVTIE